MGDRVERFARLEEIFHDALELEGAQRSAFLERECSGDPELLARVRKLLDLDTRQELRANVEPLRTLTTIGPYRAVRRIGRGGMGEVWLAERDDGQFVQCVAVKVVQSTLASEEILDRFRSERQLLANLAHPNIARLLDGGETEGGVPYFVMEYIEGEPIDAYCESRELPLEARLELFRNVCEAVQFAHSNLVVHRDIKPSNILVTPSGEAKLLDFGIAKMLPGSGDDADATEVGQRAMTPRYASPEQLAGEPVTTATDVYALGVVLYELLAGRSPYDSTTGSVAEMQRAVLETDPDRPSTVLRRRLGDAQHEVRAHDLNWRRLLGDLDTIVLKALRKEADRRYATVEQFSEDVRRHLGGLPVGARPDDWAYRTRKFVLRNRLAVVATSIVFLAVAGGFAVSYAQYRNAEDARRLESAAKQDAIDEREAADGARHEAELARAVADKARIDAEKARDAADAASEDARREAAIANAVGDFLESVMTAPDPVRSEIDVPVVRDVRVVEVLDRSVEALESEPFEFPEVEARILSILARSYFNLGDFATALDLYDRALEELGSRVAPNDSRSIAIELGRAQVLEAFARYTEAETLFRDLAERSRSALGSDHRMTLEARLGIGIALARQFDHEGAERVLRDALDESRAALGAEDELALATAYTLTSTLLSQGKLVEAETLGLDTLERRRASLGDSHARTIDSIDQLGAVYRRMQGRIRDSLHYYKEAFEKRVILLGKDHPRTWGSQSGYAQALMWTGQPGKALAEFEDFVPLQRELLGEAHPTVLSNRIEMTNAMGAMRRFDEIEPILRDVLDIAYRELDDDDHFRPHVRATYALCLSHLGRNQEAEEHFLTAYDELVKKFGVDHRRVTHVMRGIVAFYRRSGQAEKLADWEARLTAR